MTCNATEGPLVRIKELIPLLIKKLIQNATKLHTLLGMSVALEKKKGEGKKCEGCFTIIFKLSFPGWLLSCEVES